MDAYGDSTLVQFAAALDQADPERMARLRASGNDLRRMMPL